MDALDGAGTVAIPEVLALRLSPDAMQLELRLTSDAMNMPSAVLLELIRQECLALGLQVTPTARDLDQLRRTCGPGVWETIMEAEPPRPPLDGRIELLVPVPVAAARQGVRGHRHAVGVDTPLARRRQGTPAEPTVDLLGRTVLPRNPHEARLPQGANTKISDDGSLLIATCDGEVLLRNLLIEIVPSHVYAGNVPEGASLVQQDLPVFVSGSILEGARVEADAEVYVEGSVHEAQIRSRQAGITVMGSVNGVPQRPCMLRAAGDVSIGPARNANITSEGSIHVLARAWQCTLRAKGNVYLPKSVEASLQDVELHVEGGILPTLEPEARYAEIPTDRQHVRVGSQLRGFLALHSITPLCFRPCTILDLSTGGARCALQDHGDDPSPGSIVQLKLVLPGSRDQLFAIARVTRAVGPGVIGVTFLQMTQRDQNRLTTFCLQLVLSRPNNMLASREQRGQADSPVEN